MTWPTIELPDLRKWTRRTASIVGTPTARTRTRHWHQGLCPTPHRTARSGAAVSNSHQTRPRRTGKTPEGPARPTQLSS
eukprot:5953036-Alexandrium_andersonii.AAC.1